MSVGIKWALKMPNHTLWPSLIPFKHRNRGYYTLVACIQRFWQDVQGKWWASNFSQFGPFKICKLQNEYFRRLHNYCKNKNKDKSDLANDSGASKVEGDDKLEIGLNGELSATSDSEFNVTNYGDNSEELARHVSINKNIKRKMFEYKENGEVHLEERSCL